MKKRIPALLLVVVLFAALLSGCESKPAAPTATATPAPAPVALTITGGWPDCRAIDEVAKLFTAQYPNVTIEYEYLQDYYASLEKRLSGDNTIDLFICGNMQDGTTCLPYALNLYDHKEFDLSNTFDGLMQNYMYRGATADGKPALYSLPLGAEMRGMYVNKTLLDSLGLAVPTNQETLLAACETLKQKGYIPFHGNPGKFAQTLVYPWICNLIANADDPAAAHALVSERKAGVSELFAEPLSFLYELVEKDYYDYKKAQTDLTLFLDTTDEAYARDFLNIVKKDDAFVKADDVGIVAFMPSPMSLDSTIAKTKDDYHSAIEYVFIPAPVAKDGGFAYLSPAHAIAVNKNSANLAWAVKFLDFLFKPENNKVFAKAFSVIPNTKEAFAYIASLYKTQGNHISHLGQVTFDYDFYGLVNAVIVDLSKANNPKYMIDDGAGGLKLATYDSFVQMLEASLTGQ